MDVSKHKLIYSSNSEAEHCSNISSADEQLKFHFYWFTEKLAQLVERLAYNELVSSSILLFLSFILIGILFVNKYHFAVKELTRKNKYN